MVHCHRRRQRPRRSGVGTLHDCRLRGRLEAVRRLVPHRRRPRRTARRRRPRRRRLHRHPRPRPTRHRHDPPPTRRNHVRLRHRRPTPTPDAQPTRPKSDARRRPRPWHHPTPRPATDPRRTPPDHHPTANRPPRHSPRNRRSATDSLSASAGPPPCVPANSSSTPTTSPSTDLPTIPQPR
jgi:hypothetical protein